MSILKSTPLALCAAAVRNATLDGDQRVNCDLVFGESNVMLQGFAWLVFTYLLWGGLTWASHGEEETESCVFWNRFVFFCVFAAHATSTCISAELLAETVAWIWRAPQYERAIDPILILAAPLLAFFINLYNLEREPTARNLKTEKKKKNGSPSCISCVKKRKEEAGGNGSPLSCRHTTDHKKNSICAKQIFHDASGHAISISLISRIVQKD